MNKYVAAGTQCVRKIDFIVGGELVIPSAVTYTVTNNAGAAVHSLSNVSITASDYDTSTSIALDAATNTATLLNEVRYLDVSFVFQGGTYLVQDFYFLRASVHFPLSKDEVRFVVGASSSEMPDDMIDIFSAYQDVQDASETNLASILAGGGVLVPALITAVKYWAAFVAANALEMLAFSSETADNDIYARFDSVDFDALRQSLLDQYNDSLLTLNTKVAAAPTLAVAGTGIDAVTNT